MFETKKIDIFFSGENNLIETDDIIFMAKRTKIVRFFKLFLPCLTALLLGLGIILFDFSTDNEEISESNKNNKILFEKILIKNTIFEIISKDNDLSTLTAKTITETAPQSKVFNLTDPIANLTKNNKDLDIRAKIGEYNQDKKILNLNTDIIANYDNFIEVKTNSATYDFKNNFGFSNEKTIGTGEKGSFVANKFDFDKNKNIANLRDDVKIFNNETSLEAPEIITIYADENKLIANNYTLIKDNNTITGDELIAYIVNDNSMRIDKAYSNGNTKIFTDNKIIFADNAEYFSKQNIINLINNVKLASEDKNISADKAEYNIDSEVINLTNNVKIDANNINAVADIGVYNISNKTFTIKDNLVITKDDNVITANKAIYFENNEEFRLYENIKITQTDNIITADSGVYFIKKNLAELTGNVIINKNGNIIKGEKATYNLNTSKSELIGNKKKRVSGKLLNSSLQKNKGNSNE